MSALPQARARHDYESQFVQILARGLERPAKGINALDLACGRGVATRELAARLPEGSRVVAISSDRARLKHFHEQLEHERRVEIFARKQTTERLPFASGVFDVAWASLFDMRLKPLRPTLREALRVLRPGGQLLIAVLLRESVMEMLRVLGGNVLRNEDSLLTRPLMLDNATVMDAQEWKSTLVRCGAIEVQLETNSFDVTIDAPPSSSPVFCECLLPMWLGEEPHTQRDALRVLDEAVRTSVSVRLTIGCLTARRGMAEIVAEETSGNKPAAGV